MPAKATKPKKAFAPKIVGSTRIPLDDLSVAEDSGWRDEDEERVIELVQMIKDGQWGATTMAKPSVLQGAGNVLISAIDGRTLLNNGKQVVIALSRVRQEIDLNTVADMEWSVDDLEETFKTGLHVDLVEYPDYSDRDGQVACKN